VASCGTVEEILSENLELMKQMEEEKEEIEKDEEKIDEEPAPNADKEKKSSGKLIMKEEVSEGHISWSSRKQSIFGLQPSFLNLSSQIIHW